MTFVKRALDAIARSSLSAERILSIQGYQKWRPAHRECPPASQIIRELVGDTGDWNSAMAVLEVFRAEAFDSFARAQAHPGKLPTKRSYSAWLRKNSGVSTADMVLRLAGRKGTWQQVCRSVFLFRRPFFEAVCGCWKIPAQPPTIRQYQLQKRETDPKSAAVILALAGADGTWDSVLAATALHRLQIASHFKRYEKATNTVISKAGFRIWAATQDGVPGQDLITQLLVGPGGTWDEALIVAGYTAEQLAERRSLQSREFSPESCRLAVLECRKAVKHLPQQREYERWRKACSSRPSAQTVVWHWDLAEKCGKSWARALKAMGLNPARIPRVYTPPTPGESYDEQDLIDALHEYFEITCGGVPTTSQYERWRLAGGNHRPSHTTISRRLDPEDHRWRQAVQAANLDPDLIGEQGRSENLARAQARARVSVEQFVADHSNEIRPGLEYLCWAQRDPNRTSLSTLRQLLAPKTGSFSEAIAAAGFDPKAIQTCCGHQAHPECLPTRDACLSALVDFKAARGDQPLSFSAYRRFSAEHGNSVPTDEAIRFVLAPDSLDWRLVIEAALMS